MNADELLENNLGLWWKHTPPSPGHRVGCFGVPPSIEAITQAENILRKNGCTLALAPMEGNTWRAHRAVIESDGSPPFLLEPQTPPTTVSLFQEAGYEIIARYSSSQIDLTKPAPDFSRLKRKLPPVTLRPLKLEAFEQELHAIHQLSLKAFAQNFLYTPIPETAFTSQYQAFQSHLTPECAFLAEAENKLLGFVFGYPNPPAFVVKTLAVLPDRRYAGLGTLLVEHIQQEARQRGFTQAIHALQREDNQSLRISQRFGAKVFRRYALFAKEL